ncbi:MAG TPA: hypothetical protein VHE54_17370 [Puia sp.]|nr:hypothetical protein [Puia sp.]
MKPSTFNFELTEDQSQDSIRPLKRYRVWIESLIFLLLGLGLGSAVMAQSDAQTHRDQVRKQEVRQQKRSDMKDLRNDVRDHKVAKHQVNHDLGHAKVKQAMHDHKAVAKINRREKRDQKRLKAMGVDHSMAKARRQVKVRDDNRKDHMN